MEYESVVPSPVGPLTLRAGEHGLTALVLEHDRNRERHLSAPAKECRPGDQSLPARQKECRHRDQRLPVRQKECRRRDPRLPVRQKECRLGGQSLPVRQKEIRHRNQRRTKRTGCRSRGGCPRAPGQMNTGQLQEFL